MHSSINGTISAETAAAVFGEVKTGDKKVNSFN